MDYNQLDLISYSLYPLWLESCCMSFPKSSFTSSPFYQFTSEFIYSGLPSVWPSFVCLILLGNTEDTEEVSSFLSGSFLPTLHPYPRNLLKLLLWVWPYSPVHMHLLLAKIELMVFACLSHIVPIDMLCSLSACWLIQQLLLFSHPYWENTTVSCCYSAFAPDQRKHVKSM